MPAPYTPHLQAAVEAVSRAARVCLAVQAEFRPESLEKKDRSPVTIADYASQAVVCEHLHRVFPEIPVLAEEDAIELRQGESQQFLDQVVARLQQVGLAATRELACDWIDLGGHDGTAEKYWTLDPIDGTKGFLRREQFAVSLALIVNGRIEVAALACPNLPARNPWDTQRGAIFSAVRGGGAWLTTLDDPQGTVQSVRVSSTSRPSAARVCESVESGHSDHSVSARIMQELGIATDPVRLDSQAKYGVVARGEADLYLRLPTRADYHEKVWDHAGGVLVVEEAGGIVTDIDGQPLDFSLGRELSRNRGVIVSNGQFHDRLLSAVALSLSAEG